MAKKHPEKKRDKLYLTVKGQPVPIFSGVAGKGWKTYALCIGMVVFFFLIAVKYFYFGLFSACI